MRNTLGFFFFWEYRDFLGIRPLLLFLFKFIFLSTALAVILAQVVVLFSMQMALPRGQQFA